MNTAFYAIDSEEGPYVTGKEYPDGNIGHRPPIKGGYFPVPPVDGASDLRAEMLSVMVEMGLEVEKHHHEVAPVAARARLRVRHAGEAAPTTCRSTSTCVHNVAHQYGKTATFMPKPI